MYKKRRKLTLSAIKKANSRRKASGLEKDVYELLYDLKIPFKKEKKIGRCHCDIFLKPNIVIEVQGCYFHKHDCLKPPRGWNKRELDIKEKDKNRFLFFEISGFKVYEIWECDIKKHIRKVKSLLRKLGKESQIDT